mgnify:CR=1 FL=1
MRGQGETAEMTASLPARRNPARLPPAAVQLGLVWALGAFGPSSAYGLLVVLLFADNTGVLAAVLLALAVGFVGLLWLTVRLTAPASVLGGTGPRQLGWALLVFGAGTVLWGFGWALTDEAGLGISGDRGLRLLCGGLPYVLVAGLLLRGWRRRLAAGTLLVVVLGFGLVALARSGPSELALRLQHAGIQRELVYVVAIPGYRPVDPAYGGRLGTRTFVPEDESAIPPLRLIKIVAYRQTVAAPAPCGATALDSALRIADCTIEPDGLVYRRGVIEHGYQLPMDDVLVEVSAPHTVDRRALREAVATLRRLTAKERAAFDHDADDLYTADVPGYRTRMLGMPPGTMLEPIDPAAYPQGVHIDVYADWSEDPCALAVECTMDRDGLWYRRFADRHGYAVRRGEVTVYAPGGLGVDRALLRTVILDARPASDDELLRALPPPPSTGGLDQLRRWLRGDR